MVIESGSLAPGIDPARFGLPPATAARYEHPDPRLRALVPSYGVLDSDPEVWRGQVSWKLPGAAQVWVVLAGPISIRVRNRSYAPLGRAVLWGSTSQAMPITTNGGVSVPIDISPAGWARWFKVPADELRDRIVPLEQFWPAERVSALVERVAGVGSVREIKPVLDAFLLEHLPPPHRDEPLIARMSALLSEGTIDDSAGLAEALGMNAQALRRLSARYFGYPSKLLIRRIRFLRALTHILMTEAPDFAAVPPGYHSVPHFLRDSDHFLGVTPRRFLALDISYQQALLRARTAIIGAPVPVLDRVGAQAASSASRP